MKRLTSLLVRLGSLAAGVFFLSLAVTSAQQVPQYPLDDKLANEPAPWTVPGKWGKRGNWGRWGENDKRGMPNVITPDMVMKAAGRSESLSLTKPGAPSKPGPSPRGRGGRARRPEAGRGSERPGRSPRRSQP